MAQIQKENTYLTSIVPVFGVSKEVLNEVTIKQVNLTESLLTPGLQTNVVIQSKINDDYTVKNYNEFYDNEIGFKIERPILSIWAHDNNIPNIISEMKLQQRMYRLSKRQRVNYHIEQFELDACDSSLIRNNKTFVSKAWNCATPSTVVRDVLSQCVGGVNLDIEEALVARDYIAENITPFQVVSQQSEVALSIRRNDPTFLHYMTYQTYDAIPANIPTHHFRSLDQLTRQNPCFVFTYSDKVSTDINYANPGDIMTYSFPCDFDLLTDAMNKFDEDGNITEAYSLFNLFTGGYSLYGDSTPCGTTPYTASTTLGADMFNCNIDVKAYLAKRKARMSLLEASKIALRLTVPFNPNISVGKIIEARFVNRSENTKDKEQLLYGSGNYLVLHLTHNIKLGGLGTTTLDCVADTVGLGKTIH